MARRWSDMVGAPGRTEAQMAHIQQLLNSLDPFFRVRGTIPARWLQTFLLVAQKEDQTVTELAKRADIAVTTMSRILLDMGERNRYLEEGAGLLQSVDNVMNRREKLYSLTPKGRALFASIMKGAVK